MDQYLAYLPQAEGFLPKWLFFVSCARVEPPSPITTATPNPLATNASIPQSELISHLSV